jgi:hypothetical protein
VVSAECLVETGRLIRCRRGGLIRRLRLGGERGGLGEARTGGWSETGEGARNTGSAGNGGVKRTGAVFDGFVRGLGEVRRRRGAFEGGDPDRQYTISRSSRYTLFSSAS